MPTQELQSVRLLVEIIVSVRVSQQLQNLQHAKAQFSNSGKIIFRKHK